MCSLAKLMGDKPASHSRLSRYFAAVLLPGMHGVAAMVVTMVAIFILGQLLKRTLGGQNRRYAGSSHRAW